ncbi:AMP-binding protein [Streptomyces sparsogenes]|uniref:AMP-binding protein n=1 Tax=Streptomyces sparsogenes TaxID=67365 RepID=UPI0033EEF86E
MDLMNLEPIRTHPQLLLDRARSEPDIIALRHWRGGVVHAITWRTYRDRVREIALGLVDHGVQHGDRVAVMSSARPEWAFAALAVQSVGGVVVGHPSCGSSPAWTPPRRRCPGRSLGQRGRSRAQRERGIQASYPTAWSSTTSSVSCRRSTWRRRCCGPRASTRRSPAS